MIPVIRNKAPIILTMALYFKFINASCLTIFALIVSLKKFNAMLFYCSLFTTILLKRMDCLYIIYIRKEKGVINIQKRQGIIAFFKIMG